MGRLENWILAWSGQPPRSVMDAVLIRPTEQGEPVKDSAQSPPTADIYALPATVKRKEISEDYPSAQGDIL